MEKNKIIPIATVDDNMSVNVMSSANTRSFAWLHSLMTFCGSVSILGVRYVANPSASAYRRLFWLLLVLVGVGFTAYQIQERVRRYFSYPVNFVIRQEHMDEMPFPTVTICNENRVSLAKAQSLGLAETMKAIFPPFPMAAFVPNFTGYDLDKRNIDWEEMYLLAAPYDSLIYCQFNAVECSYDRHFEHVTTNMGICFSFNNASVKHTSRQPGSPGGLMVVLHVNQLDYLYSNSPAAGFRILLHESREYPMMIERGLKVAPGTATQIAITAEHMTELSSPYGDCEPSEDYSQTKCLADCKDKFIINECKCREVQMTGDVPICDPKSFYQCGIAARANYVTNNEAQKCKCRRQCSRLVYQPTISQSHFAISVAQYIKRFYKLNDTADDILKDHCLVEIFFSDLQYTRLEAVVAYSLATLLPDIGGSLSLILGSTMLTVCEIVDFIALMAVEWIKVRASVDRR